MGRLIEDITLREKVYVFKDRADAGKRLSEMLHEYKGKELVVLAVPSGGVPVGFEIAEALVAPLDLT